MTTFRRILVCVGILICAVFISSCATPISVSEVMQQPDGTKYYLAHNIWFETPSRISSINYQSGTILLFGTEIQILNVTRRKISFKVVATGLQYTIIYYEKYGMKPVGEYLKTLITTQTRSEMSKGISTNFLDDMQAGTVLPGMTKKEVMLTYGPPSPHRTPSQEMTTWIYWLKRWPLSSTSRVIFKKDKVLQVMK